MRILILNYEYPPLGGGAATFTQHIAEGLSDRGHNVLVVTGRWKGLPPRETPTSRLRIRRLWTPRHSVGRASLSTMAAYVYLAIVSLPALIRRHTFDACLCLFAQPCGPVALAARKLYRLPYVLSLRGADVPGFSPEETDRLHQILAPVSRRIWSEAAIVTTNSRGLRDLALRFQPNQDIRVIPNCVDTATFCPTSASSPAHDQTIRFLYVGRLTPQKNLRQFFDVILPLVFSNLPDSVNIQFTIVGEGPLQAELYSLAQKHHYHAHINFRPWLGKGALPTIYRSHTALVFPSLYEGMSNVVLEAKACGLPVIAYDAPGNREMLEPDRDYLCSIDAPDLFAEKICRVACNPQIHRHPTKYFLESFSRSSVCQAYETLLKEAQASR